MATASDDHVANLDPIGGPMRTMRTSIQALLCLGLAAAQCVAQAANPAAPIDRHALVTRHNIVVHVADPNGAMAVGNGEFAFNFDITGLQSFPEYYEKTMPIGILSNWGWHGFPNPNGYSMDKFKMQSIPKYDRQMVFPASSTSNPPPDAAYLRENPNRFGLGRIGLEMTHPDRNPHQLVRDRRRSCPRHHRRAPHARRGRLPHRLDAHRRRPPQSPHRFSLCVELFWPGL
jgi:hypothetical protein